MIRIRRMRGVAPVIPQVSMSDIAFLLLIFFISMTIFDFESGIPLVLPATGAKAMTVQRRDLMAIRTDASGGVRIDGAPVALDDVASIVRARVEKNPQVIVSIETDPMASYGVMIRLLDAVRLGSATRISLRSATGRGE